MPVFALILHRIATFPNATAVSLYTLINWDIPAASPVFAELTTALIALKNESLVSSVIPYAETSAFTKEEHQALHSQILGSTVDFPHSFISHPVHNVAGDYESEVVATLGAGFAWDFALRFLLPDNVEGIIVELHNTCNQTSSYYLNGHDAFFIGEVATHETKYGHMEVVRDLSPHTHPNFTTTSGHCQYSIHIFPSTTFVDMYDSNTPEVYASVVALTFVMVGVVFFIYDMLVHRRNEKLIVNAARSNAIVSSMFPEQIRDRLLDQHEKNEKHTSRQLKSFLLTGEEHNEEGSTLRIMATKPLADLFLETTIMFADIVGFTAWSSVREPCQVFSLLESVFSAFDTIAKRRRVFKVETVGDCYVAVSGLPEPRKDHAVVMARFARDLMTRMDSLTKQLEVTLGPDTGDLTLRIGMHSGPVTGGVLRGARSRFQLFGDTMNTTARIESTGYRGRIHLSQETGELLIKAGKQSWLQRRDELVMAKGKGYIRTFWLNMREERRGNYASDCKSESSSNDFSEIDEVVVTDSNGFVQTGQSNRTTRLIDWNVEQLLFLLKQMVAHRKAPISPTLRLTSETFGLNIVANGRLPLDEVQEIITLPDFDKSVRRKRIDPETVVLSPTVIAQLKAFVTWVASMYRNNPFHNFDHASHVLMSVIKLMSRIVAPTDVLFENVECEDTDVAANLHDHTYGITSDPLTQFACAFSALVHDVDHTGVPNATLVAENAMIATLYKNRSVAEQNSLDLAWNTLLGAQYADLCAVIFTTEGELKRFRQLVVNSVMATDIVDKDLKVLRNDRWDKAFKTITDQSMATTNQRDVVNRKATIVIEHLIQASDVSHTMQHWHVFRKWNQLLFEEMYRAYKAGRAEKDPSEFWYQGEIGFFDFYVIPLAKKLKDCGVFGVSSDEYLNYATKNREEWATRGLEIVAEMVESASKEDGAEVNTTKEPEASTILPVWEC